MSPTPKENPWEGLNGPRAGACLTTCPHCDTRTWVYNNYIDPFIPREECAHCGTVWEGEEVIDAADDPTLTNSTSYTGGDA